MKILLVIEGTYPWYRGGVSEWVHQYIKHFRFSNFDILQVATDEFRFAELNSAIYELPSHVHSLIRIPVPEIQIPHIKALENWWTEVKTNFPVLNQYDVIHVTNTGFAGYIGYRLSRELKRPFILTEHAIYWKEVELGTPALECGYKIPDDSNLKRQYVNLFKDIAMIVYRECNLTVSVSNVNIPMQKQLGAINPLVIPNGVSSRILVKNDSRDHTQPLVLGWVGRCAAMKNPHKFLDLVEEFHKKNAKQFRFLMLMSDAGEPQLEQQIRSRIKAIGGVEMIWNHSAIPFLKKMDAVVITSVNESQPLVMFEALGANCLPVGWEVGDFNKEFGYVVPPETSIEDFADKLSFFASDLQEWNQVLAKSRQKLMRDHLWSIIFKKYDEQLKNLLS